METIAGIELGGTKALAVLARGSEILASARFATTTPDETLAALVKTLQGWKGREEFAALGIASFGPLRLDPGAPDFGTMLATPKAGWSGADIAGALSTVADCPWRIDTDVNAAALAEWRWGAGHGLDSLCYLISCPYSIKIL
ncbi:ROK family protein [Sphingopyxis sp. J-6]|uniref:ROK family protein n=1 Tax=Sphingopyxis sp. J-6 TaxID=3122054 RepID=UPI003983FDF0